MEGKQSGGRGRKGWGRVAALSIVRLMCRPYKCFWYRPYCCFTEMETERFGESERERERERGREREGGSV
jgi:hypothetical protein